MVRYFITALQVLVLVASPVVALLAKWEPGLILFLGGVAWRALDHLLREAVQIKRTLAALLESHG